MYWKPLNYISSFGCCSFSANFSNLTFLKCFWGYCSIYPLVPWLTRQPITHLTIAKRNGGFHSHKIWYKPFTPDRDKTFLINWVSQQKMNNKNRLQNPHFFVAVLPVRDCVLFPTKYLGFLSTFLFKSVLTKSRTYSAWPAGTAGKKKTENTYAARLHLVWLPFQRNFHV